MTLKDLKNDREITAIVSVSEEQIEMLYDDVYKVTKVDMKDFGSPSMQHWQVGGS